MKDAELIEQISRRLKLSENIQEKLFQIQEAVDEIGTIIPEMECVTDLQAGQKFQALKACDRIFWILQALQESPPRAPGKISEACPFDGT